MLKGRTYQADVYDRRALANGQSIDGPAIIEQDDSTTLILPNWQVTADQTGNLIIERKESGR